MPAPSLSDYGIIGLFLLLFFQYVVRPLINKRVEPTTLTNGNGNAGDKSPDYWKAVFRETTREAIEDKLTPIMSRQTQLLEKFEETMGRVASNMERLIDRRNRA